MKFWVYHWPFEFKKVLLKHIWRETGFYGNAVNKKNQSVVACRDIIEYI